MPLELERMVQLEAELADVRDAERPDRGHADLELAAAEEREGVA